jgi:predicted aspartyl protease
MHSKIFFYTLVLALVLAGGWGMMHMGFVTRSMPTAKSIRSITDLQIIPINADNVKTSPTNNLDKTPSNSEVDISFAVIQGFIRLGDWQQAANKINQHYSYLSRKQLNRLKQDFLNSAARASKDNKENSLIAASRVFDELDIWKALASAAETSANWQLAFDAQLRASELENDSVELEALLINMLKSSGYLRADYEKNSDQLSIKIMYQRLVDLHPHFSLFQLELAHAHTQLNNYPIAENIYTSLRYDPEFGEIAQSALARIKDSEATQSSVASIQRSSETGHPKDIVVPLIAVGNSFLIDASIERQGSRLLLDTGASITALSSELIRRLNLEPTGKSIQLSTANGLTIAKLYKVNSLSLGRLTLQNMIIAEIDLGQRREFDGLLGTDALNEFKSRYNYVIDNQSKTLIFRPR